MKKHYFLNSLFILFLLTAFSQFASGQKKILYVGADDVLGSGRTCDLQMIDSLLAWGYDTLYLGHNTYDGKGAGSGVHSGIDGVFFGESVGSSSVTPYGPSGDNFPVPAVALEAAAFGYSGDPEEKWALFNPESTPGAGDGGGVSVHEGEMADATDLQFKICDTKHYITEVYELNQIITWSSKPTYDDLVPYIHGLRCDVDILALPVAPVAAPLDGKEVFAVGMLEDNYPKVKIFWVGNTHKYLNDYYGTPEFYALMKRGCDYTFDNMPSVVPSNTVDQVGLVAYPNPAPGDATIRFHVLQPAHAQVSLLDVSGKQVDFLYDRENVSGYQFVTLKADKYPNGMYFVKLQLGSDVMYTKVMLR
jgi:hypothetical protein